MSHDEIVGAILAFGIGSIVGFFVAVNTIIIHRVVSAFKS